METSGYSYLRIYNRTVGWSSYEWQFLMVHRLCCVENKHVSRMVYNWHSGVPTISFWVYTSGYATWFTAGGAICIAHYDVIDDVITRKL